MYRLALAAMLAASALAPAAPANAAFATLCPPGYAGVMVYDGRGNSATICIPTDPLVEFAERTVDTAVGVAGWASQDMTGWAVACATQSPPPEIDCGDPPPPPLP